MRVASKSVHRNELFAKLLIFFTVLFVGCGGGGTGGEKSAGNYSLSGTLNGLSSDSLEICNNQEDPITLTADGAFSLNTLDGSGYEVRVVRNPIEMLCRVENGSGSNLRADVNDIRITCESVATAICTGNADSDGDTLTDCAEIETWKTNPWMADTDGDAYPDDEEVLLFDPQNSLYIYNPRIADMAAIAIDLTSLPQVDMVFTTSDSTTREVSSSHQQGSSDSISHDWGGENSQQIEIGHTQSLSNTTTAGVEVEIKKEGGVSFKLENSLTIGFEHQSNETQGSVVNWNASEARANSTTYEESVAVSEESGTSYENGRLEITAKVRNAGYIPYDLENLTLTAFFFSPEHPFDNEPIGTLTYSNGDFPTTSILSGESPPLNFSTEVSLQKAQRLLRDSKNIVIVPATYRLLDADDSSMLLRDEDVSARTAAITIDYGVDATRQDKYRVAINCGDGTKSIGLLSALEDILGLTITQGPGYWIYGDDSAPTTTPDGLLSIGNYAMDTDTNQYWLLAHYHATDGGVEYVTDFYHLLNEAYDLNDIVLRAGDKVTLVYVGDADRDGLSDRLEHDYGTAPDKADTDGDGLLDAEEIYGWMTNLGAPPCDSGELVRVYSNPLEADSDADGTSDSDEKSACANPSFDFVAQAGEDIFVNVEGTASLNGDVQSVAPVNATYQWQLVYGPDVFTTDGVTRELSGRQPSFSAPDEVCTLIFELEATAEGATSTDRVKVQVQKDRLKAAYVGDPATGPAPDGSTPYATLPKALHDAQGMDLYVMSQSTPYSVGTVNIPDGISLFGGYDANWVRDADTNKTHLKATITQTNQPAVRIQSAGNEMWFSGFSVFADASTIAAGKNVIGMKINGGSASAPSGHVYISDSSIVASDVNTDASQTPGSSYALLVNNLQRLDLETSTLVSGEGGRGKSGNSGSNGDRGNDGAGSITGGSGGPGGDGGDGGGGGTWIGPIHYNGYGGSKGTDSSTGEAGGAGGSGAVYRFNFYSYSGEEGTKGTNGARGIDGAGGGLFDTTATQWFEPADGKNGTDGHHGAGGGGGGGGTKHDFKTGGKGGGGGEGGEAGTAGTGGAGGGASIGLWLDNVTTAYIGDNTITVGNGGNGGSYGYGGSGGSGGYGGDGTGGGNTSHGGWGGDGGRGGNGGHGGAGSGGPSIGVYVTPGSAPVLAGNTITTAFGGYGGYGGSGNSGDGGHSYPVFDADPGDGQLPDISGGNTLTPGTGGSGGASYFNGTSGEDGTAVETNF